MKPVSLLFFYLSIFLLPTQFGLHFWSPFSLVLGRRIDYLSPALYLQFILILASFTVTILLKKTPKTPRLLKITGMLLVVLGIQSFMVSQIKELSLYFSAVLGLWWIFVWIAIKLKPYKQTVLTVLGVGLCVAVILTVAQFLQQSSLQGIWYFLGERRFDINTPGIAKMSVNGRLLLRSYSTFPHPNVLGGFLVVLLPFYLFKYQFNKHTKLVEYCFGLITIGFLNVGLLLSFSRSVWIVALATWLFWCYSKLQHKRQIGFIFILIFTLFIVEEIWVGRFNSLVSVDQESVRERIVLNQAAEALFKKSPIFGVGLLQFIPQLPTLKQSQLALQPVHSIYWLWLVETGLSGFILISLLTWKFAKFILCWKETAGAMAFGAILILGAVDHNWLTLVQGQGCLAIVTTLIFACHE